jgi:ABC-type phosphonate transport system ATPase subunit
MVVGDPPLLAVEALSYGYPGHVVGSRISFAVARGEVLCVLGRNGEGKSTLCGSGRTVDSGLVIGRLRFMHVLGDMIDDGLLTDVPLHRPIR